jgi:hypothetical protein
MSATFGVELVSLVCNLSNVTPPREATPCSVSM